MPRKGKTWRQRGWGGFVYGRTAKDRLMADGSYRTAQQIKHKFEREKGAAGPCRELTVEEIMVLFPGVPVLAR